MMGSVPELGDKLGFLYKELPAERPDKLPAGYLVCATQEEFARVFGISNQAINNAVNGVSGQRAADQPSAPMERSIVLRYGFGPPQSSVGPGLNPDQVDDAWEDWFRDHWPGWRGSAEDFKSAYRDAIDRGAIAPVLPDAEPLRSTLATLHKASASRRRSAPGAAIRPPAPVAPGNAARDLLRFAIHAGQVSSTSATFVVDLTTRPLTRAIHGESISASVAACRIEVLPENGVEFAPEGILGQPPFLADGAGATVTYLGSRKQPGWLLKAEGAAIEGTIDQAFATIAHSGTLSMTGTVRVAISDLTIVCDGSAVEEDGNKRLFINRLAGIVILEDDADEAILSMDSLHRTVSLAGAGECP